MCVYIKLQQEISPISLFDANIGSETTAVIDRATAKPAEARTIYAKEYVDGNRYLAAASYDRAFNKYYEAGKKGMSFSDIKRSSRDIKADSARRIYEAGRRATENESKRQEQYKRTDEYKNRSKERTEQNTAAEKLGGVVREYSADKKISRSQRRQLKLFDVWAKKKGVVIRVVSSLAEKYKLESKIINGEYAGGNTIVIALDGKNALTSTAGHEMYHMIENLSPEYAQSFREFVIDHLKAAGQYENVFKDYERRYGKAYARDESFKAKIDEEIVADHCFEAMTNKEQWDSFAAENKTLAEKIKDFILEFVAMINRAYDKYFAHDNAEIRNEVLGEIDYMNEIAKRLWEGVDEAVENYRFGAGTESETRFSINEIVDDDGNKYGIGVVLDSNLLEGLNQNERKQMVKERVVGELAGQQVIAYDKSGNAVEINFAQKGDKFKNKNGKNASVLKELYHKNIDKSIKQEAVVLADELVESAKYRESEKAKYSHDWLDSNGKNKWDYWDVYIQDKNKTVYVATLNVANTQNGSKILYDIDPIKKARGPMKSGPTIANINISQNDTDVNTHSMQKSKKYSSFSISDEEYMSAAESGDTRLAQRMVNEAAGEAGYNSPQLYHGTQNFGFTEFDLNKMGDGRSIFLTSSRDIASTYSGVGGKRNIETPKSSANMTIDEVANALNEVAKRDNGDLDLSSYRVMNQKDLTALERSVDKGIEDLYDTVQKKIDLYGERLARDFNDKDEKTLNRLVDLSDLLEHYSYDKLSTPLYMLLHHSDAFTTEKFELSDLEADVRLMQLLKKNDLSNGVVVAEDKDRYYIRALDKEKAAKLLDEQNALGNYALFAKLGNSLEIDGKGKNWNKIFAVLEPQEKTTLSAKYNTDKNTLVLSDEKGIFAEIKRDTLDEAAPAMARAITNRYGKFLAATVLSQARDQLKNSATAEVQVRAVGDRNTREIAEFAEEQGYDSVVFRDLMDNGGQNSKVASSVTADIYIIFDPNNVKSADPITYDNDGNIIPLSERFNENEKDIRYQISEKFYDDFDKWDGKDTNTTFEIGNTSKALQSIGIKDQQFIMRSGMVRQKPNKHSELTRSTFRNIPELLEHPVIVQFSDAIDPKTGKPKYDSRITLLGELYAEMTVDGKKQKTPVLVSVELLPKSKGKTEISDFSIITSAYGHSRLQHYLNENSILYIDPNKKRTNKWLSLNRLQLPLGKNRLGSVRRITYTDGKVKIENSKNSTPMQFALEKAGLVNSSGISILGKSGDDTSVSKKFLTDETKTSISDAGMRLTDDAELSSLLREQAYKEEIERLKGELVKSKRMGGKGKNRLVQADINRITRDIISEYSSKINFSTLRDELTGLYELMDNIEIQGSADYAELVKLSNDIAKSVIASSYVDITDQSAEKYKAAMRSYRLTPSLQDVAELEDMFGTFGAAYRQYGRKLNMRAQGTPGALHIDEVWEDLCDSVPFLDRDAESTQDMWRNLIEVRDSLDEKNGFNPYITDGDLTANEAAGALGADILERFNEVRADTTFADRAQQRVDLRFPIVVMRVKIFSLTGCSDIINPSLNRTLSRNSLTARPHTLSFHTILSSANKCADSSV